jgi:ATP-dependent DNA helicase RecG
MAAVTLETPLRSVVGAAATKLRTQWDLHTVGDLLEFLPRTYIDATRPTDFRTLTEGEHVVIVARVVRAVTRPMRARRGSMLIATVADDDGNELDLTFFKPYGHERALVPGRRVLCTGTYSVFRGRGQLTHPEYEVLDRDDAAAGPAGFRDGPIPVYRTAKGLNSMQVAAAVELALHALGEVPDPVPEEVRAAHRLPGLRETYQLLHQPTGEADHRRGRRRMKWQEAFVIQAALAQRRRSSRAVRAVPRPGRGDGLAAAFRGQLPFALTSGQERVLGEILEDLADSTPMHRLLQGEVGSGKTVVALLAMLTVVDSGAQAALLAPTEVLAVQHHRSITRMLGPLAEAGLLGGAEQATRVALLTGSQSTAERRANLLMAASGEAGIVVGTHALIQEHVQFADLGLVVVDEQHRFGVEQRDALRAKASTASHVLVMTATPIPRTVAMTVYGDMETSTLSELPAGRQPIATHVVTGDRPTWIERTWQRVAEEVAAGGQVYVVCPRIGEPDDPDLPHGDTLGPGGPIEVAPAEESDGPPPEGVEPSPGAIRRGHLHLVPDLGSELDDSDTEPTRRSGGPALHGVHQVERALRRLPATSGLRIATVHGRMSPDEKDATMRAFAAGEVDVLVATTVIEVGVDVPNATQMVILDADRFGISQLHQLRGRVGRGSKPGLCLLVTQGADAEAPERLAAVASTTDGFELARLDLELRREGDVLGAAQSGGRSTLRMLRLTRDEELIVEAHEAAWRVVEDDPELESHPALRAELERIDAERAAFLERG